MNTYQRGNRDGLLNAAAEYEAAADAALSEIARIAAGHGFKPANGTHAAIVERYRVEWARNARVAKRLYALSEAMPEDPEQ